MSETKHTPGPWRKYGLTILGADGIVVAELPPGPIERHANGRLIIAAPDLLAACKRQLANIERWLATGVPADAEESESIYKQMKAAIAKATEG